jgi:hypothetical protein
VNGGLEGRVGAPGRRQVAETFGMKEFDGVPLTYQNSQALADIVLILVEETADLGDRGDPSRAQGDQGLLLAAGEIGELGDGARLRGGLTRSKGVLNVAEFGFEIGHRFLPGQLETASAFSERLKAVMAGPINSTELRICGEIGAVVKEEDFIPPYLSDAGVGVSYCGGRYF